MDAKRIAIFVVLLVLLVFAGKRACDYWKMYRPPAPRPGTGAPAQPAQPTPAP